MKKIKIFAILIVMALSFTSASAQEKDAATKNESGMFLPTYYTAWSEYYPTYYCPDATMWRVMTTAALTAIGGYGIKFEQEWREFPAEVFTVRQRASYHLGAEVNSAMP